ncbi:hypothetical protein [Streptomyces roseifaciens]|uniref:hypothetical protein n=1 Tax=Streptomyces roseifaciens TaxID=1488406 RepID=UPI00118766AC|nr:hypothetical protein [Streptomyces roseifaciens]
MTFLRNAAVAASIAVTAIAGLAAPAGADPVPNTAEAQATSTDGQSKTSTAGLAPIAGNTPIQRASSSTERELAATCWNGRTDGGRNFFMTCNGTSYHVYVDCTDGRHLFPETFSGQWDFRLTCPVGTRAVWGGSW